MSSNHFLVSFQSAVLALAMKSTLHRSSITDAPPELSEPAMTSIRLLSMSIRFLLLDDYIISLVRWVECGDTRRVGCTGVLGRKESETYRY